MDKQSSLKHYIFFIKEELPKAAAHLVQSTNAANGAANLGLSTVLVYPQKGFQSLNPSKLVRPFQPCKAPENLVNYYNLQEKLQVSTLPLPYPIDSLKHKLTNSSTVICKYYLPFHILPKTKLVHSRDWNFIKAAVKNGIAVVYEHHHHEDKKFEPEIVNNPLFQIAITVSNTIRETMIANGMPPNKVIKLHNGYNQLFMERQPEKATEWRKKLLTTESDSLVVYSGALRSFKGIDILIDVAKAMPKTIFVCAGGNEKEVDKYQQIARSKQVTNIKFIGYILHNELASLLQAANVLVHPHCSGEAATFTSPLKLFDYFASGTPIVATEIPSLEEFKQTNAIAAWCEADSITQLTSALQQTLEKYPYKKEGYQDSIEFVQQFSWENRAAKILEYVDKSFHPDYLYN